jgi:hypothetical protein
MTTNDLFICQKLPSRLIRQASQKHGRPVEETDEHIPWWAYRRPTNDSLEKAMDLQALNLLASAFKEIC